jgi:DNA-binding Lrp family transcriptional regulator
MKTSEQIIQILEKNGSVTAKELYNSLTINKRAVFKQLANLLDNGVITKIGKPPKVFYSLSNKPKYIQSTKHTVDSKTRSFVEESFEYITPRGEKLSGWTGFVVWSGERNLNIDETAERYIKTVKKYDRYKKDGLIDGMYKLRSSFDNVGLDKMFYLDFYSIEIFGKTKLGQLLLYAKQSQNRQMINEVADFAKPQVERLIRKYKIDAVGFIPPTVKRELQFMNQFRERLSLNLKEVNLVKLKTPITVPQKTLTKIEDRIVNAKETIEVKAEGSFTNILLIDDAVGSGSTLNEVAKKIRLKNLNKGLIVGLAVTGSFKGFEVISEV